MKSSLSAIEFIKIKVGRRVFRTLELGHSNFNLFQFRVPLTDNFQVASFKSSQSRLNLAQFPLGIREFNPQRIKILRTPVSDLARCDRSRSCPLFDPFPEDSDYIVKVVVFVTKNAIFFAVFSQTMFCKHLIRYLRRFAIREAIANEDSVLAKSAGIL